MDKLEFSKCLAPIVAQLPDTEKFAGEVVEVYYQLLKDVPVPALRKAVYRHLAETTDRWMPSVGKLRSIADEYVNGTAPHWSEAWELVLRAARHWSQFDAVKSNEAWAMLEAEDGLRDIVKALGGFYQLTNCESVTVLQGQFRSAYTERSAQAVKARALPEGLRPRRRLPVVEATAKMLTAPGDSAP